MLAIIGGSGLTRLDLLDDLREIPVATPYSDQPIVLFTGMIENCPVAFLPRHGVEHAIPPHKINYRANIHALKQHGVTDTVAINAVGGIDPRMSPGQLAIPDQLIDYTYGREHTYHEENLDKVVHIDLTHPYNTHLRNLLILAVEQEQSDLGEGDDSLPLTRGVFGVTQGPRLETAAEIIRLRRDGCDMVGMTGMPEAALAREQGIRYACLALSVNRAAGLEDKPITMMDINRVLNTGIEQVKRVLRLFVKFYGDEKAGSADA